MVPETRRLLGQTVIRPPSKQLHELADGGSDVQQSEAGYRPAHEPGGEHGLQPGHRLGEIVAIPECRPGDQKQQKPRFEQQSDEKQTAEQGRYPLAWTFDSRSMRPATSR